MKKEFKITLIILIIALLIAIILGAFILKDKEEKTDAIKFKEEYESLNGTIREKDGQTIRTIKIDEENPIVYATAEEIVKKIEKKETFAVYFGFSDCPWCRSVLPTLIEVANDLKISKIYYVDVKEIRDVLVVEDEKIKTEKEGTEGYYKLLEKLDSVLSDYSLKDSEGNNVDTNEKRIYAPNIVSIVNGKPEKLTSGISKLQTNGYMELTEEIEKDMYEEIKCALQCVKDNQAVCENAC